VGKAILVTLLFVHGGIHLLGAAQAFRLATLPGLTQAISPAMGLFWAVCTLCFVGAAVARITDLPQWWMLGLVAVLGSQALIFSAWTDARLGTIVNVVLLVPIAIGFGEQRFLVRLAADVAGMGFLRHQSERETISDAVLVALPPVVAKWIRRSGVMGQPRARLVYLTQKGRMRKQPNDTWMPFRAQQWFSIPIPAFVWAADVDWGVGVSIKGKDRYGNGRGEMRIELLALVPLVDASGEKIDQGARVRFLAEIMWFPSAALEPYVKWEQVDARSARATIRDHGGASSGVFRFDEDGDVVGFEAKRYRDETLEDWVIENTAFADYGGVCIPTRSRVTWRNDSGDSWTWLELEVTSLQRY